MVFRWLYIFPSLSLLFHISNRGSDGEQLVKHVVPVVSGLEFPQPRIIDAKGVWGFPFVLKSPRQNLGISLS